MIKIGVTGGIGSGKTMICEVFQCLGVPVFNADIEAKKIMSSDKILKALLIKEFGAKTFDKKNKLNNKYIAEVVFNKREKLARLNSIVHPFLFTEFFIWAKKQKTNYVVLDAAIIFESKINKKLDYVITVYAPPLLRIKRIMKRDNVTKEYVVQRMKNQIDDEKKVKLSDFVIYNDGKQMVMPQVLKINKKITTQR
ncbi:MAG: dephospho-CoA kinase [Bacteroidales bacterium]|nr:dephospho-CoA kinase [Bacteroidales bacterium]